jgi:hypothetical protein
LDQKPWKNGSKQNLKRLPEAERSDKEVKANRGCRIAQFQVPKKDDAEMDRVYTVAWRHGKKERDHYEDGAENVHQGTRNQKDKIQKEQKDKPALDNPE